VQGSFRSGIARGDAGRRRKICAHQCPAQILRPPFSQYSLGTKAAGSRPRAARPTSRPLEENVDRIIEATLALEGGNRSRTARRLGIGLRTLQRRLAGSGA